MSITPLKPEQLYRKCTLSKMPSRLKKTQSAVTDVVGQEAAEQALLFAAQIKSFGYNAFCIGPRGIGKKNLSLQLLKKCAEDKPTPEDLCYLHPLRSGRQAVLIKLPAGKAASFEKIFQRVLAFLIDSLPESLYSSRYLSGIQTIKTTLNQQQAAYLTRLKKLAKGKRFASIAQIENGIGVVPVYKGKVVAQEDFAKLPEKIQSKIYAQMVEVRTALTRAMSLESPPTDEGKTAEFNFKFFTDLVRKAFSVIRYADMSFVEREVVEACLPVLTEDTDESLAQKQQRCAEILRKYQVDVLVSHPAGSGAPVVYVETMATINKLFGFIERTPQLSGEGDWRVVGGDLHQANGGFLVCRAADMPEPVFLRLIEAIKTHKASIETSNLPICLQPADIPLNLKVVLVGSAQEYNRFCEKYASFLSLFKVMVPFVSSIARNKQNTEQYASLLMLLAHKYNLKPLTKGAVELLIELSSRLAANQNELSARISWMTTLMKEADYWAGNSPTLQAKHIEQALLAEDERSNMMQKQILQRIQTQQLLLSVSGEQIGQVNVLYVMDGARFSYGRPARTTCRVRIGTGQIWDVETKSQLGGNAYAKGITILQSFMAAQFGQTEPLCIDASVVLEQSYLPIDGDSASCAQLCALLSAVGQLPISQSIALTGSVNQLGQIQSVGSVNEKIEGFFDVCQGLGLTGTQGVIIPRPNECQLMLRADVIKAVQDGLFHVWSVDDVYDAMELLTGKKANYINKHIQQHLHQYFVDSHKMPL